MADIRVSGHIALELLSPEARRYADGEMSAAEYFASGAAAIQTQAEVEVERAMRRNRRSEAPSRRPATS